MLGSLKSLFPPPQQLVTQAAKSRQPCCMPDCGGDGWGKPYCGEHATVTPYAQEVQVRFAAYESAKRRLLAGEVLGSRSFLADELVRHVEVLAPAELRELAGAVGLPADVVLTALDVLERAGRVRLTRHADTRARYPSDPDDTTTRELANVYAELTEKETTTHEVETERPAPVRAHGGAGPGPELHGGPEPDVAPEPAAECSACGERKPLHPGTDTCGACYWSSVPKPTRRGGSMPELITEDCSECGEEYSRPPGRRRKCYTCSPRKDGAKPPRQPKRDTKPANALAPTEPELPAAPPAEQLAPMNGNGTLELSRRLARLGMRALTVAAHGALDALERQLAHKEES